MKKLLPILLVLMMLCSTAFAAGFEVPAEGYDGSEVTITFCTQQGTALQEVTANYIAEFNKLYPNIHVEHTTQGSYDDVRDQIVTDISVGAQPNVAYCYPDHVALYNLAKAVQTLDELIDSKVEVTRAFVKMFNEWYNKGYLTTQKLYGAYTSGLFTATTGVRSYMSIGSSAGAKHQRPAANADGSYPFEVGIATIPQVNNDNRKVISQGPSVCIFKKDNPQEVIASWLFVKFLTTSVDFQAEFSMASGYVPVIKSVTENTAYADFLAQADGGDYVTALSTQVCLEQADAYYTSPAFVGSSTARDQVAALLSKCLTLTGDDVDAQIETAFEEAIDECEYAN